MEELNFTFSLHLLEGDKLSAFNNIKEFLNSQIKSLDIAIDDANNKLMKKKNEIKCYEETINEYNAKQAINQKVRYYMYGF